MRLLKQGNDHVRSAIPSVKVARQIFEIGWKENGLDLELRVHIVPVDVECE